MQASALRLLWGALLLLAACMGQISEVDGGSGLVGDGGVTPPDAAMSSDGADGELRPDAGRRPGPPGSNCPGGVQPLARGMRLRELAMYQTVKVSLFEKGSWHHAPNRSAAIIRGKEAYVRVFVDLDDDYEPHSVRAALRLKEGADITELFDTKLLQKPSTDEDGDSTFSFPLKSSQIGENTEISIALEEPTCKAESGPEQATRYPTDGWFTPLEAAFVDDLHVVLMPIVSNGRTPRIDPAEREKIRRTLLAYYPVPDVIVQEREPVQTPTVVDNTADQPWHDMLQVVFKQRQADDVPNDVYYVGLVQPGESMREYCQNGCYLGIAPTVPSREVPQQIALVAIFPDSPNYESIVHELGHAHGRAHAPCANDGQVPTGADKNYPLSTGNIETWGWDFRTKQLIEPDSHMDVMGYCEPNWISTYTYSALIDRSQEVNGDALLRGTPGKVYRHVVLYGNGDARWGSLDETLKPTGVLEKAEVLDAEGKVLTQVNVTRIPLSHTRDQWAYLPRPEPGWSALRLSDRIVQLADILPPR